MRRALVVARRGDPSPGPRVGAVLARGAELVSVGYQRRHDAPHAALHALERAGARARGATLYLTSGLERPAAGATSAAQKVRDVLEALAAAGVVRIVVGCAAPQVRAGHGNAHRRIGGARPPVVQLGSPELSVRAEELVADFRKFQQHGLPFVTLKAAVTLDGRTAARSGESKWITGPEARREAHRLRVESDAVLVGVGTVLADDPELTVRAVRGRNPLRVVLDTRLRTPLGAKLVTSAPHVPTLILHAKSTDPAVARRAAKLRAHGVELAAVRGGQRARSARRGRPGRAGHSPSLDIESALRELARRGVVRLLVEGGAHVHAALIDAGLADRAAVFVAPRILADMHAVPMVASTTARSLQSAFVLEHLERRWCGRDVLFEGALRPADALSGGRSQARHGRRSSSTTGPEETTKV